METLLVLLMLLLSSNPLIVVTVALGIVAVSVGNAVFP